MAMLETAVEQKADVVCLQVPPRDRAGSGISHLAYDIWKWKKVWMAVRMVSSLPMNERTNLMKNAGHNIIVAEIKREGENMIRIVIINDQRARETGERPGR
jgi:hypothetical protein